MSHDAQFPPAARSPFTDLPSIKLYSVGAVVIATFLGAPIAGCVIMAINYARLGMMRWAWLSVIAGLAATALLLFLPQMLLDSLDIPTVLFWLPQLLILGAAASTLQGATIKEHVAAGGKQASNWGAAGIGLGCCILILGLVFGVAFATMGPVGTRFPVGSSEIYYSGAATEADGRIFAEALTKEEFFPDHPITLQLSKDAEGFTICFVVGENALTDATALEGFRELGESLSKSPLGRPLTIWLCDDVLTKRKKIVIE